jgi:ribonuclease HI
MELRGVIAGLAALKRKCRVMVVTDSKYVTEAINQGWLEKWQAKGWKNAQKKPVANRDLWEELLMLLERHEAVFQWVRSHSGHPENSWCDYLAKKAACGDSGPLVPDKLG